jgi:hypothetical protein
VADTPVLHPLGIAIVRRYLLEQPSITTHTTQIATEMPPPAPANVRFPAIRLTELGSTEVIPRVWMRMAFEADCWSETQAKADRLGRAVVAVLRACANTTYWDAVMGETTDLVVRAAPDPTLTPAQPRAIVTGNAWIRPS